MKSANNRTTTMAPEMKTQFLAEIEFGMPSKKCRNFGICNINPLRWDNGIKKSDKSDSLAIVTVFDSHHIEFDFLRSSITIDKYEKYFSKAEFLVGEDYHFNTPEKEDHHFIVAEGKYFIYQNNSLIKVVCRVPTALEQELMAIVTTNPS